MLRFTQRCTKKLYGIIGRLGMCSSDAIRMLASDTYAQLQ